MTTLAVNLRKPIQKYQHLGLKILKVWKGDPCNPEDSTINVYLRKTPVDCIVPVFISGTVVGHAYGLHCIGMEAYTTILLDDQYKYVCEHVDSLNIVCEVALNSVLETPGLKGIHIYEHVRL